MDSVRNLAARVVLSWGQALLLVTWSCLAWDVAVWLSMLSLAAAFCSFAWGLRLIFLLRRGLLWRRRRSVRPSREVLAERRRIAADLHDHVGAQLVQVQALLAQEGKGLGRAALASRIVERSLLELRLIVDSMDASDDPLDLRLARLRHRFQPLFEQRGVELTWDVAIAAEEDGPELPRGAKAGEIAAIAQEALSNALQHAQASVVKMTLHSHDSQGGWLLQVRDDGIGLEGQPEGMAGMGLANMRRRAVRAGADLGIDCANGGGTIVRLSWPR